MKREKNLETCLVISTGLLIFWFIYQTDILVYIAFAIGLIGAFFNKLAGLINWLWYKIADLLGFITSKILLSILFFVFLFPIAILYRFTNKNALQLKRSPTTYWKKRNHTYNASDIENLW